MSFDLKKYWDGQPVRFVCCERAGGSSSTSSTAPSSTSAGAAPSTSATQSTNTSSSNANEVLSSDGIPIGRTFWVVQFEIWEDGDGELEEREGSLVDEEEEEEETSSVD